MPIERLEQLGEYAERPLAVADFRERVGIAERYGHLVAAKRAGERLAALN
jgi:hypothetical protein